MTFKQFLQNFKSNQALLHYNIATFEQFKAGIESIKETNIPLIFGLSESEREYFSINESISVNFIKNLIYESRSRGLPVFLNADHCKSIESSKKAIDNLFDSVLFDGSELNELDNILRTKEVKEYVKSNKARNNKEILIEGEIGYLPGKSDIQDVINIDAKNFTNPESVENFLRQTNVDLLAISVGNFHGIASEKPQIDFERIKSIYEHTNQFKSFSGLVLHGGSGLTDNDYRQAIENGIKIIHINTEFRKIWKENLLIELEKETVAPYKIYEGVINKLKERIMYYQKLFLNE